MPGPAAMEIVVMAIAPRRNLRREEAASERSTPVRLGKCVQPIRSHMSRLHLPDLSAERAFHMPMRQPSAARSGNAPIIMAFLRIRRGDPIGGANLIGLENIGPLTNMAKSDRFAEELCTNR